jgi:hypothetical protein
MQCTACRSNALRGGRRFASPRVRRRSVALALASLFLLTPAARAERLPIDAVASSVPVIQSAQRVVELSRSPQSRATVVRSPLPFRAFGMRWEGDGPAPQQPGISVRFSRDGETWTGWMLPGIDHDSCDRDASDVFFALVFFDAHYIDVEYAVSEAWLASGVRLAFEFIDPGESAQPLRAADLARSLAAAPDSLARPTVVSRTEWGCPEGQSSASWAPQYTDVSHLIVHHTATASASSDWPAQVRSIWTVHTYTRDWGDIGYNYLIDPLGVIYEGRSGGDDVIGAHFSCANSNTMGVALLGEFGAAAPTLEAQDSLERLLAWKASQRGIDPLGASEHPPTELVLDNISGHRDANGSPTACTTTTICPGDQLYALLPEIRTAVAVAIPEPGASERVAVVVGILCVLSRRRRRGRAADRAPLDAFAWMSSHQDTQLRQRRARRRPIPARPR